MRVRLLVRRRGHRRVCDQRDRHGALGSEGQAARAVRWPSCSELRCAVRSPRWDRSSSTWRTSTGPWPSFGRCATTVIGSSRPGWGMRPEAVFGDDRERDLRVSDRSTGDDRTGALARSSTLPAPGDLGRRDRDRAPERVGALRPAVGRAAVAARRPLRLRRVCARQPRFRSGRARTSGARRRYGACDQRRLRPTSLQMDPGRCLGLTGCTASYRRCAKRRAIKLQRPQLERRPQHRRQPAFLLAISDERRHLGLQAAPRRRCSTTWSTIPGSRSTACSP